MELVELARWDGITDGRSDGMVDRRLFSRAVGFCNLDRRSLVDLTGMEVPLDAAFLLDLGA